MILKKVDHLKLNQADNPDVKDQPSEDGVLPKLESGVAKVLEALTPGTRLQGRYELESVLGVGGMSIVYKAKDLRFPRAARPCAVKEMFCTVPEPRARELSLQTFEREAGFLATLSHPSIPKVFDYFSEAGRIYLVLEYIEGQDLERMLQAANGPLAVQKVLEVAVQVCDVLTYLHGLERPVIFRDLKPSNIILTNSERAVLIDFGIAKTLQVDSKATVVGTEGYAPPEQYRGVAEPRGDVYSLGASLHHLLTNSDPRMETPFTFHERPISKLNPDVWPSLEAVIMKALTYEPVGRFGSAAEMKEALLQSERNRVTAPLGAIPDSGARRSSNSSSVANSELGASASDGRCVWSLQFGDEIRATPLIIDDVLYVGSYDNYFYAVRTADGSISWKQMTKSGICSSAAPSPRCVLVGSEDGKLYSFLATNGDPVWTYTTPMPIRSSPRLDQGRVCFGSDDRFVYCLDHHRGRLIWKYRTWLHVRSSPTFWNGRVFIGSGDGYLYCLDAEDGHLIWKYQTMRDIVSSPVVSDGVVYVGSKDGYLYALDVESSWAYWRFKTAHQIVASPSVEGNTVFIGSADAHLYALDRATSELVWRFGAGGQVTSSARQVGEQVLFGCVDGNVYSLKSDTGELAWKFKTRGPVVSTPAVEGGLAYVGSTDGKLYALKLDPAGPVRGR